MLSESIKEKINIAVSKAVVMCESQETRPLVCIICDCLIKSNNGQVMSLKLLAKHHNILKPMYNSNLTDNLRSCYEVISPVNVEDDDYVDLSACLLSPRATYLQHTNKSKEGFTCCCSCKLSIKKGNLPKFCIANNFCFGETPDCLLELTDIELAMISPIKTYGYCFSYTGGVQKQLKGSLSYYKISKENTIRAAAYFETLKINCNVIVMLYGNMTKNQYEKAKKKVQ
jgi:hypothetical protein